MQRVLTALTAFLALAACQCGGSPSSGPAAGTTSGEGLSGTGTAGQGGALFDTGAGGAAATGGPGGCIDGLQSITLSPADAVVMLDGQPAAPLTFVATGKPFRGQELPIAGTRLAWSAVRSDDTPAGTIVNGILEPNPSAGGTVTISASDGCVTGSTTVSFMLDATLHEPADPGPWAGMTVTGPESPQIVYPSDATRFPRNLYRTIFQWYRQGMSDFRLVFEGPHSTVTVYTDGVHGLCTQASALAGCWEVNELAWSFIAGSNAGETVTWYVEGLDHSTAPPLVRRSAPGELGFSKQDVKGAIFYWSTTSAGVRRGRIAKQKPEDYVVGKTQGEAYGTDKVQCVACHVVSRDGKYLVAPVESYETNSLWVFEVTPEPPPPPLLTSVENTAGHGFATISPDNDHIVVAWKGEMWMVDRATGTRIADLPTDKLEGTHPDWSPLGFDLVFATGNGDAPLGSSLAKIAYRAGNWESPEIFLPAPTGLSNLFPMFSPGADWIAFSQGKGGHGDLTAQLFITDAAGQSAPIELFQANHVTSNEVTDGQYQNSEPTWAPPGDYHWIAFNSKRPYGVIRHDGTQQIWVTAIDPARAAQGLDPSYPAFRVPFQGLDEDNHRSFWTRDITDGTDSGGVGGGGVGGGVGGGGAGAGGGGTGTGGVQCADILAVGQACDPLRSCCETDSLCGNGGNGAGYTCQPPPG
jgi:hypothetical protein